MMPAGSRSSILIDSGSFFFRPSAREIRIPTDPALIRAAVQSMAEGFEDYTDDEIVAVWGRLPAETKRELLENWKNADSDRSSGDTKNHPRL